MPHLSIIGLTLSLKEQLGLIDIEEYNFLSHSNCFEIEGMNDKEKFLLTVVSKIDNTHIKIYLFIHKRAMDAVGIDENTRFRIFRYLSAILLLGNLQFSENGTSTKVINKSKTLSKCAKLLSIEDYVLETYLTKKYIFVEGKEIETQLNSIQAKNARDALSKIIYERIFQFIAGKINESMKCTKFDCTIDILDIYGFESFENNSFEQLIINFVNEKLQNVSERIV